MASPAGDLDPGAVAGPAAGAVRDEAARRRTFAVISHPDAGKSTLTEALALHARAIGTAGAVHGKAGRRGTVSDWMEMERARGISVSSTALQFGFDGHVLNLVDTPGHADFSEDTYRVLSAVDCAVMLLDAAKGLEPQTLKLFEVCASFGTPVVTVVNKWDRPGLEALELMDEIRDRIGLRPTPMTWPVGVAGDFHGVLDRRDGHFIRFERTAGGATIAPEHHHAPEEAASLLPDDWQRACEEHELLTLDGADHDQEAFLAGRTTPVVFAAAVHNLGVRHLLDLLVRLAPAPDARADASDGRRQVDAPFSAFVFKVQAGMDRAHRDRLAFARVCSGVFERGMVVTHEPTERPFATKYAQAVFGRERATVDTAYPGDVIGLVNATALRVGDTLYTGRAVAYPRLPHFAPEHFATVRPRDLGRYKQFRRGIDQMDHEGVVQVLRSDRRGDQSPVLAAVGPMQFEVLTARMADELGVEVVLETLPYSLARLTDPRDVDALNARPGVEVLTRGDGALLALFPDQWRLQSVQRALPDARLDPLPAGRG